MSKYRIVAETGSDVPKDIQNEYNITMVPMHVTLGDATYDDGTISVEVLFDYYDKTGVLPTTSASSPADFNKAFDEIHESDPDAQIIHLAYSAVTTCSFEAALVASADRDYVTSIDTKMVSAGQALIVNSVAKLIEQQPNISLENLKEAIRDRIERARMGIVPATTEYLHAGGRLSNAAYLGAQLLKIKPLIEIVDGRLVATKRYRGSMAQVVKKVLDTWLEKSDLDKEELFLLYSPGLDKAIKVLAEETVKKMGFKKTRWLQTGSVVSSHGGPGAFGITGFAQA